MNAIEKIWNIPLTTFETIKHLDSGRQPHLKPSQASRSWTLKHLWVIVCSGRSGYSGHPWGVQNLDACGTLDGKVLWTLYALWTLWGVQTRVVLINCCIPQHVEMVWRPAQESNLQASRVNQLKIWATYKITVQYMCNWKSTLKRRCKPMSLKDFFTGILEGYLISRT